MAMKMEEGWQRTEFDGTPIYVRPDAPDWLVPNRAADEALVKLLREGKKPGKDEISNLLKRISGSIEKNYKFRTEQLKIDALKECWLHITNRCNMNCPICIANIPSMGFEFNPPLSYFEKVLKTLSEMDPKPWAVNLFGGEPTVRDDMFEIVEIGQRYGLDMRLVTNGLKLADEEYCRKICDAGLHVLLAFDGKDPKIYERLRKSPDAYEK